jgi:BioD-like phosphotransacetylase family protein
LVSIYVTTKEKGSGNTLVCASIGRLVINARKKPGYLKPVLSAGNEGDAAFVKKVLSLDESLEALSSAINGGNISAGIKAAVAKISQGKDVVVIDGPPEQYQSSLEIAKTLNAKLLIVESYTEDISQAIAGYREFGQSLIGVIYNKVPERRIDKVKGEDAELLEKAGITFLGAIQEDRVLSALTIGELATCIDGSFIRGKEKSDDLVENLLLGAMTVDSGPEYFGRKENKAAIIRSERPDMQLAAISTSTKCLVLTGKTPLKSAVLIKAEEKDIPVITTSADSGEIMERIEAALANPGLNQINKLARFEKLMKQNIKIDILLNELGLS